MTHYRATMSDDLQVHEIDFRAASPQDAVADAEPRIFSPSAAVSKGVDLNKVTAVYRDGIGCLLPEQR